MNEVARLNKTKVELSLEYNHLDMERVSRDLTPSELERLHSVEKELDKIWALEEIKARQRSRNRNVLEWDRNTAYFHAVANYRNRKKNVLILDGPEGPFVEQKAMMEVAVNFYKDLFKNEGRPNIHLADDFWSHNKKVTEEENNVLTAPFTELDIKEAVFSCYAEGAPGPDGISFVFYNKFWDLVKGDLVNMFNEFFSGELDLYRLNFAMISLIPKEEGARSMKKFGTPKNLDQSDLLIAVSKNFLKF